MALSISWEFSVQRFEWRQHKCRDQFTPIQTHTISHTSSHSLPCIYSCCVLFCWFKDFLRNIFKFPLFLLCIHTFMHVEQHRSIWTDSSSSQFYFPVGAFILIIFNESHSVIMRLYQTLCSSNSVIFYFSLQRCAGVEFITFFFLLIPRSTFMVAIEQHLFLKLWL